MISLEIIHVPVLRKIFFLFPNSYIALIRNIFTFPFVGVIDGNWGQWESWSECSKTCDIGVHTRSRTCSNPAPLNGGKDCVGSATEESQCSNRPCNAGKNYSFFNVPQ